MNALPQIHLIRHAETAWSLSGQHTGRTDLPLTAHGQAMARNLATTLNDVEFSLVLTSPLRRARDTCMLAGLATRGERSAESETDLIEWDYGDYEGLRTAEIRALRADWNLWEHGCPGGESPADVGRRADQVIARLRDLHGNVALVSHGHFGRVLAARWIGLPLGQGQHFALDPASISILGFETSHPRTRVIARWNAVANGVAAQGPDGTTGQQHVRWHA